MPSQCRCAAVAEIKNDVHVQFREFTSFHKTSPTYRLCGFVLHIGDNTGGHYASCTHMEDNQWRFCDDRVSPVRIDHKEALLHEASLLIYQKVPQ